ncbi:unnamed protein product [Aureobasidium uvarum]|uniref:Uncharacterized protein n=1 Tax=Aureobasidium uvarum TaxID=2773716 RepID=A0A9N8KJG9_9PEZI|nr:unnamed protein product [Aureobasidium uvarum]
MADNPGQSFVWWKIFFRSALVFVATCITICTAIVAIPVLFVMFVLVAVSPESFSNLSFGDGTARIRLDLNITYGQPRSAGQRPRRTTPRPTSPRYDPPSSPQSPSSPAYTWVRQYHAHESAPIDTTFAAHRPYTWRASSGNLPSNANITNSLPPYLPPISEPEPIPQSLFPSPYDPYTSMDPSPPTQSLPITSPPTRRRERVDSDFSWAASERLPPARPDEASSGASRPEPLRRTTAESMPELGPIVDSESDDEVLPEYEPPPEYDDERHSQSSPR